MWSAATDSANTAKTTSQNGDNDSLYLHGLKNVVWELLCSLCVYIVSVKINNDELFCNAFPFQNAYMILFLDSLLDVVCTYYYVARVTCLVGLMQEWIIISQLWSPRQVTVTHLTFRPPTSTTGVTGYYPVVDNKRNAVGDVRVSNFLEKALRRLQFNVISVTRGWAGVEFPERSIHNT